jgi:hypothetical protein
MPALMRLRSGLANVHLQAALYSAKTAHEVEKENVGKPHGPWFDGMMRAVPVSIVMAGAALEASGNELLQDFIDRPAHFEVNQSHRKLLSDLKEDRTGNAVGKFRSMALLMSKDPDTGTEAWQDAARLVRFRNEFMHFKPAWDDDAIHNTDFVQQLARKVPTIQAYRAEGNLFFPYGFMTYGCAKWAVKTVLKFYSEFAQLLGVQDRFAGSDWKLP